MIRSLAFKLVLAFLLVSIIGAAFTALFARWATLREFDRLVLEQVKNDFLADVTDYYQTNGSWLGVTEHFRPLGSAPLPPLPPDGQSESIPRLPPPPPEDRARYGPPRPSYLFALVDRDGYVVMPARTYRVGDRVQPDKMAQGVGVEVDGQVVGVALVTGDAPALSPQEKTYLARTNQASLYAALAATLIALALGVLMTRTLTRPVREMMAATRAMSQGELEQRVPVRSRDELGELAVSFNQMSADLARANELRRQMTADIAHDLRTPLTVLAGYLEALRDGVLKPGADRFDTMYQEAQHLQRLVEDLRTLSLADASELTLNQERVPPQMVLEQAAAAYRHQAEQQAVALRVDCASDLPQIDVDPDRMAQVLCNLVGNALRHTPPKGQILLTAAQRGKHVLLTVQDTGAGIALDDLPRVFDRFYRGDETRHGDGGESGLGLAIARSIVKLHGGTISVESTLGEGTTFTVALQACESGT